MDGQPTVVVRGLSVDGCTATLENSTWIDMTFRNARVHYSGGPISLHNVVFENCLFEFDMRRVPTSSGERFSSQVLLAPSLSRLVVNVD